MSCASGLRQGAGPVWSPQTDMALCPHLGLCPYQDCQLCWRSGTQVEDLRRGGRCGWGPPLSPATGDSFQVSRICQALSRLRGFPCLCMGCPQCSGHPLCPHAPSSPSSLQKGLPASRAPTPTPSHSPCSSPLVSQRLPESIKGALADLFRHDSPKA